MKKVLLVFAIVLTGLLTHTTWAADDYEPAKIAATIAPYVDDQTIAIGHVDLTRLDAQATIRAILGVTNQTENTAPQVSKIEARSEAYVTALKKVGVEQLFIVVDPTDLSRQPGPFVIAPLKKGSDARAIAGFLFGDDPNGPTNRTEAKQADFRGIQRFEVCVRLGDAVFCGSEQALKRLKQAKPAERLAVKQAFADAGPSTAQLIIVPGDDVRRAVDQTLPRLPEELGGGSTTALTQGLQRAAIGINSAPDLSIRVVVQSADRESAQQLRRLFENGYRMLGTLEAVQRQFPNFEQLAKLLTPEIKKDRLEVDLTEKNGGAKKLLGLVALPFERLKDEADRERCKNSLKHLGLAMHNFHDVYQSFPPSASYDKQGKKLLSWRVFVLPFIDQNALYKKFHLDEPWDSEHNRSLIERMPKLFGCGIDSLDEQGTTTFLAPLGKETLFSGKEGKPIREVTDGTSNTIMLVEADAEHAVIWTKPDDLEIDLDDPAKHLAKRHFSRDGKRMFYSLFCDGSVHFRDSEIDAKKLRAFFTCAGEELASFD